MVRTNNNEDKENKNDNIEIVTEHQYMRFLIENVLITKLDELNLKIEELKQAKN
jgi:hypothetical protein